MNPTQYWNKAAKDPEVDVKYICDIPTEDCFLDLGEMKGKVLEIGCGVGRLLKDGDYGIDLSGAMLNIASERKPKCHFALTKGDIPYKDNTFDNIFCYLVFQHCKPNVVEKYINEAYRVLKDGGQFKFQFIQGTEREPLSNHYSIAEMQKYMYRAGFPETYDRPSRAHQLWTIMGATK